MKHFPAMAFAAVVLISCGNRAARTEQVVDRANEPIVGLPCEGCDAVFEGLPDSLGSTARIAPQDEPGDALRIDGTVRDKTGRAMSDVIVYAYHTDAMRRQLTSGRGGRAVAMPTRDEVGSWRVTRDIVLGERVPGYPERDE